MYGHDKVLTGYMMLHVSQETKAVVCCNAFWNWRLPFCHAQMYASLYTMSRAVGNFLYHSLCFRLPLTQCIFSRIIHTNSTEFSVIMENCKLQMQLKMWRIKISAELINLYVRGYGDLHCVISTRWCYWTLVIRQALYRPPKQNRITLQRNSRVPATDFWLHSHGMVHCCPQKPESSQVSINCIHLLAWGSRYCVDINPYPTAFPYGNGMVLHFYQQQESSTTKTVHRVINKRLKAYV